LVVLFLVLASLPMSQSAFAQATQVSSSVSLTHLNVQLSYPSEVFPNQNVTVSVQATAKDRARILSLEVRIYYADGNNLRLLSTTEIAKNMMMERGGQINRDVQATVPLDAPRTSLIAVVSERVREIYHFYDYSYYYPYYWNYSYYAYYPYYYYIYPTYGYTETTDDAIAALSYIKATTPEYVSLQSEYQMLQRDLNETQTENQRLQQDLQAQRDTINEKNSMISELNDRIASRESMIRTLEVLAAVLVVIIAFLGGYLWIGKAKRSRQESSASEEPSTT